MKHALFFIVMLLFGISTSISAQETFCHTPSTSDNEDINEIISKSSNAVDAKLPPVSLKIYFHVIRRTNSTGGYLPWEVQQSLDILQTDFNPHGIFFAWDGCIDYIDNDARYIWNTGGIFNVNNHTDGIDVYLFPDTHNSAGGLANGVGSSSECWVAGSWNGDPVALTKIVSHEVGHVLFLWHTHHGCEFGGTWELVSGANCAFAGDFVCDTPADPFLAFNVDANCEWTGVAGCSPPEPVNTYMPDEEIIMAYTDPDCMAYFTPGQGQRMQFAIMQLAYLQACVDNGSTTNVPCDCPAEDLVFDQDIVIDQDLVVTGDIEIINGAQVTILGATVFFTTNHGIDMEENTKLLVDGGTLTSCDPTWRGVRVTGGNNDWDVTVTNNSLIENTSSAAIDMLGPNPMPGLFGNGILKADNSQFDNTFGMVNFNAWGVAPNNSIIDGCAQNGGTFGIRNFNCQLIQILGNSFDNITTNGIETEAGALTIVGNKFRCLQNDILYNDVSAGISSIIEGNHLEGDNVGYRANGTTFSQNQIFNNEFFNPFVGAWNQGLNSYIMGNNLFEGQFIGSASQDNGGGVSDIHNNSYEGNFAGLYTSGTNPVLNFFENCFETSFSDVYVLNTVAPVIHNDQGLTAENCFTHGGVPGPVQDLGGSPAGYFYLEDMTGPDDCENAILAHPNVTRFNFTAGTASGCGVQEVDEPPVEVSPCFPKRTLEDASAARDELMEIIQSISNNETIDKYEQETLLRIYRRCLKRVKYMLAEIYLRNGKYYDARLCFEGDDSEQAKIAVYSTYLLQNKRDKAKTYLQGVETSSEAFGDFKNTQKINLLRLPEGPLYKPTEEQHNLLYEIGMRNHEYAGFARALYFQFYKKMINNEIDDIGEDEPKSKPETPILSRDIKEPIVHSYPNPFSSNLNIDIQNVENVSIEIQNLNGKTVFSKLNNTENLIINTDGWQSGIYILKVQNGDSIIKFDKLILLK